MATYKSNTYEGRYLQLTISESTNAINNTSTLYWTLTSTGGAVNYYSIAATTVTINGTTVYSKAATSWSSKVFPAAKGSVSGSITVSHNSDGKKSITIGFSTKVYYSPASEYGGTMTLTNIDRTAPSVSISTSGITASSVTVKATASTTCNRWDYSTNNGSNWVNFSTTSGASASKTITGLSPNTTYNIKVRARKSHNHVYGNSGSISVKTLGGSIISAINTLTVDNEIANLTLSVIIYNSSYTHTLIMKKGSKTVLTLSNIPLVNGSNTIELTTEQRYMVLTEMSNVKSFTATFELETFNGLSQIGNISSKTATVQTTSANSAPILSGFTYLDTNELSSAVTSDDQIIIQGISTLKVIVEEAIPKNGATISSYSVVAGDATKTSTTTEIEVGKINTSGIVPVIVTAIDSRGYTSTATINISVLKYEKIEITEYFIRRVNEVEEYTEATISGNIMPIVIGETNKNNLRCLYYRYKKTSDDEYSQYYDITDSTTHDDDSFLFQSNEWLSLDAGYSYYIEFLASDMLTSDTVTVTIPQAIPLLSLRRKKIGVNNRNPQAAVDVVGDILLNGNSIIPLAISNDNGNCIKYPDGTMICYKTVDLTMNIDTQEGSMYYGTRTSLGDYAQKFISTPVLSVSATGTNSVFLDTIKSAGSLFIGTVNLYSSTKKMESSVTVNIIAIGKWK